jgi:hypothetical protein
MREGSGWKSLGPQFLPCCCRARCEGGGACSQMETGGVSSPLEQCLASPFLVAIPLGHNEFQVTAWRPGQKCRGLYTNVSWGFSFILSPYAVLAGRES